MCRHGSSAGDRCPRWWPIRLRGRPLQAPHRVTPGGDAAAKGPVQVEAAAAAGAVQRFTHKVKAGKAALDGDDLDRAFPAEHLGAVVFEAPAGTRAEHKQRAAAETLAEAARIISGTPGAINLRTLNTVERISTEPSQKTTILFPVELLEAVKTIGDSMAKR